MSTDRYRVPTWLKRLGFLRFQVGLRESAAATRTLAFLSAAHSVLFRRSVASTSAGIWHQILHSQTPRTPESGDRSTSADDYPRSTGIGLEARSHGLTLISSSRRRRSDVAPWRMALRIGNSFSAQWDSLNLGDAVVDSPGFENE